MRRNPALVFLALGVVALIFNAPLVAIGCAVIAFVLAVV